MLIMHYNRKAVALHFIFLLAGQHVHRIIAARPHRISFDQEKAKNIAKGFMKEQFEKMHDWSSDGSTLGRKFNASHRMMRAEVIRQKLFEDFQMHRKALECTNWDTEKSDYTFAFHQLVTNAKIATDAVKNGTVVPTKWAKELTTSITASIRQLSKCLDNYNENKVTQDEFKAKIETCDGRWSAAAARLVDDPEGKKIKTCLHWSLAMGAGASKKLVEMSNGYEKVKNESHCTMVDENRGDLETVFMEDPLCETTPCKNSTLSEERIPEPYKSELCSEDNQLPAVGSGVWKMCGWLGAGSTYSCNAGVKSKYNMCCCRQNRLNPNPDLVNEHSGCVDTNQKTKQKFCLRGREEEAAFQRKTWYRLTLIAEERFGVDCNFEYHTGLMTGFKKPMKELRAQMEKELYKEAWLKRHDPEHMPGMKIDEEFENSLKGVAERLVEIEEESGKSLVENGEWVGEDDFVELYVAIWVLWFLSLVLCGVSMGALCGLLGVMTVVLFVASLIVVAVVLAALVADDQSLAELTSGLGEQMLIADGPRRAIGNVSRSE